MLTRAHGVGTLHEQTRAVDVTEALADVDARLHDDVLAVERSLGDVRARIEQLEAEARNAHGRVDLATVDVELTVSRDALPATLPAQARVALRDGVVGARTMVSLLLLFALRAGPSLALLGPARVGAPAAPSARHRAAAVTLERVTPAALRALRRG